MAKLDPKVIESIWEMLEEMEQVAKILENRAGFIRERVSLIKRSLLHI